ncbi:hypothetical protein FSP39_022597 [Pinctada imbricata]|uniref:Uncharacterized protein n=1 Tax=Pinctada imbricata TaxID=66713 RepID=A0AA89BTH6_PINIB|nr:hypothetical protein FSP39_022597 [Pinctada imbricata]
MALKKELDFHRATDNFAMINRLVVGTVLVYLQSEDPIAAERFYQNVSDTMGGSLGGTEEAGIVEDLLLAYNDGDEEKAREVLNRPYVRYMDNCFAKIAKGLNIPGGMGGGGKSVAGIQTVEELAAGVTSKAQIDDDLDDGLL